jgi:hypothetical protein
MTQRHYHKALHELERLQAQEAEEIAEELEETAPDQDPDPEPAPVTSHNQTPKPQNGFVPQVTPDTPSGPPPDGAAGKTTRH